MKLLALEVSTEACSVALLDDGRLATRHEELGRGHAERLLPMIDELLRGAGLALAQLDAIAFGRGPGGFTGVRLGASVAQGLAFGAGLPVVPVSTLGAVAQSVLDLDPGVEVVLVCSDARMQEVYWAAFERGPDGLARTLTAERVDPPAAVDFAAPAGRRFAGAGRGFAVHAALAARYAGVGTLHATLLPQAAAVARLAVAEVQAGRTRPAREALPVYVRDQVARPTLRR
ncbi:MAG: tRNA (adenosine(37)-N6)-threonylcarbamoyltransferase complex dimerization subunit type 1 TsaB [Gammaproteobacteria bacterium]|nr:tRNA (adenosine(37)-N6)-threonylcarbamoyltransferase complex dimerization subunit type 1 TsaB [Gammaproteobacteria bacterium]